MDGLSEDDHYLMKGKRAYRKNNYKEAIDDFQLVLKLNANNLDALYYIGLSFNATGDYKQAIEMLNKIADKKMDDSLFWSAIGNAYEKQRDYIQALKAYKNLLRLTSDEIDKEAVMAKIDFLVLKADYPDE
jgi:tetratricopeptide (TPR) repeat protein